MNADTYNDHDVFVIDLDGRQHDPIVPRSAALQEKIARLREGYCKRGLPGNETPNKKERGPETQ
jgi:hypothetical protein